MSHTPETDALDAEIVQLVADAIKNNVALSDVLGMALTKHVNLQKKLERERDEARNIVGFALDKDYYEKYQKFCAELEVCKSERDQLRKVADGWKDTAEMLMAVVCNASGGDWKKESKDFQEAARRYVDEYYERLKQYNSLPHVVERNKTK